MALLAPGFRARSGAEKGKERGRHTALALRTASCPPHPAGLRLAGGPQGASAVPAPRGFPVSTRGSRRLNRRSRAPGPDSAAHSPGCIRSHPSGAHRPGGAAVGEAVVRDERALGHQRARADPTSFAHPAAVEQDAPHPHHHVVAHRTAVQDDPCPTETPAPISTGGPAAVSGCGRRWKDGKTGS